LVFDIDLSSENTLKAKQFLLLAMVICTTTDFLRGWRIGSIKAILPETQMYWNALFIDLLFGYQQIVAPFAR